MGIEGTRLKQRMGCRKFQFVEKIVNCNLAYMRILLTPPTTIGCSSELAKTESFRTKNEAGGVIRIAPLA